MKLFLKYLNTHIKSIFLFIIFGICYMLVMCIFDVRIQIIMYGAAICIFIGAVLASTDFAKYKRKHEILTFIKSEARDTLDNLPAAADLIEDDYQQIIKAVFDEKARLEFETSKNYKQMCEYYTIWVHQIKTPIAAMRLILQSEGESLPAYREISDELFKIEQYVEMVLCYLRLDGDGSDFVIKEYSVDEIVTQAVKKYAMQFIRRHNKLNLSEMGLKIVTDEKWMLFIIEQVLSNALKYTENGEISIYAQDDRTLVIKDTGIGIAKEDLPRIFEKGFTGYNGRADKKSTGIGLYLCRRIAVRLGCEISAESEQGEGTAIKITFNLTKV